MIGSIIGDIVGSIYEFGNIKTKDFEFLSDKCSFTDDSVLTVATAEWILKGGEVAKYYSRYGNENPWPMGGYGESFKIWIVRSNRQGDYRPYNSCGNGSAMRVGPVGWAFNTKEEVLAKAKEALNVPTTIQKESKAHRQLPCVYLWHVKELPREKSARK